MSDINGGTNAGKLAADVANAISVATQKMQESAAALMLSVTAIQNQIRAGTSEISDTIKSTTPKKKKAALTPTELAANQNLVFLEGAQKAEEKITKKIEAGTRSFLDKSLRSSNRMTNAQGMAFDAESVLSTQMRQYADQQSGLVDMMVRERQDLGMASRNPAFQVLKTGMLATPGQSQNIAALVDMVKTEQTNMIKSMRERLNYIPEAILKKMKVTKTSSDEKIIKAYASYGSSMNVIGPGVEAAKNNFVSQMNRNLTRTVGLLGATSQEARDILMKYGAVLSPDGVARVNPKSKNFRRAFRENQINANANIAFSDIKGKAVIKETTPNIPQDLQAASYRLITLSYLMTAAVRGLMTVFMHAAKSAEAYGTSLGKIQGLMMGSFDDSNAEIATMQGSIEGLTQKYGMSLGDVSQAAYEIVSAFPEATNKVQLLDTATRLARSGVADVTTAMDGLISVSKAYGDTTSGMMNRLSDISASTVKLGLIEIPELSAAMQKLAPAGAMMSVPVEQLYALMGVLSKVSGTAANAGTQLRTLLFTLQSPGKDLSKLMSDTFGEGTGGTDFVSQAGGVVGAVKLINEEIKRTGKTWNDFIGPDRAQQAAMSLLTVEDSYNSMLEANRASVGELDSQLNKAMNGVAYWATESTKATARVEASMAAAGKTALPFVIALKNIQASLAGIASGAVGSAVLQFLMVATTITAVTLAISGFILMVKSMKTAMGLAAGGLGLFSVVSVLIALSITGLMMFYSQWDKREKERLAKRIENNDKINLPEKKTYGKDELLSDGARGPSKETINYYKKLNSAGGKENYGNRSSVSVLNEYGKAVNSNRIYMAMYRSVNTRMIFDEDKAATNLIKKYATLSEAIKKIPLLDTSLERYTTARQGSNQARRQIEDLQVKLSGQNLMTAELFDKKRGVSSYLGQYADGSQRTVAVQGRTEYNGLMGTFKYLDANIRLIVDSRRVADNKKEMTALRDALIELTKIEAANYKRTPVSAEEAIANVQKDKTPELDYKSTFQSAWRALIAKMKLANVGQIGEFNYNEAGQGLITNLWGSFADYMGQKIKYIIHEVKGDPDATIYGERYRTPAEVMGDISITGLTAWLAEVIKETGTPTELTGFLSTSAASLTALAMQMKAFKSPSYQGSIVDEKSYLAERLKLVEDNINASQGKVSDDAWKDALIRNAEELPGLVKAYWDEFGNDVLVSARNESRTKELEMVKYYASSGVFGLDTAQAAEKAGIDSLALDAYNLAKTSRDINRDLADKVKTLNQSTTLLYGSNADVASIQAEIVSVERQLEEAVVNGTVVNKDLIAALERNRTALLAREAAARYIGMGESPKTPGDAIKEGKLNWLFESIEKNSKMFANKDFALGSYAPIPGQVSAGFDSFKESNSFAKRSKLFKEVLETYKIENNPIQLILDNLASRAGTVTDLALENVSTSHTSRDKEAPNLSSYKAALQAEVDAIMIAQNNRETVAANIEWYSAKIEEFDGKTVDFALRGVVAFGAAALQGAFATGKFLLALTPFSGWFGMVADGAIALVASVVDVAAKIGNVIFPVGEDGKPAFSFSAAGKGIGDFIFGSTGTPSTGSGKEGESTGTADTPGLLGNMFDALAGSGGILMGIINGLSIAAGPLQLVFQGINTIVQAAMVILQPVLDSVLAPLVGFLKIIGMLIGTLLVPILKIAAPIIEFFVMLFLTFYNYLVPVFNVLFDIFTILANVIKGVIGVFMWLGNRFTDIMAALSGAISDAVHFISFGTIHLGRSSASSAAANQMAIDYMSLLLDPLRGTAGDTFKEISLAEATATGADSTQANNNTATFTKAPDQYFNTYLYINGVDAVTGLDARVVSVDYIVERVIQGLAENASVLATP